MKSIFFAKNFFSLKTKNTISWIQQTFLIKREKTFPYKTFG